MKIGIITRYYNNINYGGQLQAFALQKVLSNMGYESLQVCLNDRPDSSKIKASKVIKDLLKGKIKIGFIVFYRLQQKTRNIVLKIKKIKNGGNILQFSQSIPHTEKVYEYDNVNQLSSEFDLFVFGSDIIWNPSNHSYRDRPMKWVYFGNFTNKKKISYAASFGGNTFTKEFLDKACMFLKDFSHVSVREESGKKAITSISSIVVDIVCDPTLLLDRTQWEMICKTDASQEPDKQYVFAYILGDKKENRKIAIEVASSIKRPLYTLPFIGDFCLQDAWFGDKQLTDMSVGGFLTHIKNADVVVSDSFHAIVFSLIFNKKFVALLRNNQNDKGENNARITNLLAMFDCSDRLALDINESKELIEKDMNYENINRKLLEIKKHSISWLQNAIDS